MCTKTLCGRLSSARRTRLPPGPEIGKWPMSRALRPPPCARTNSSSVQKVPSNSTRSQDSSIDSNRSSTAGTAGRYAIRFSSQQEYQDSLVSSHIRRLFFAHVGRKTATEGYSLANQLAGRFRRCYKREPFSRHKIRPDALPRLLGEHVEEYVLLPQQPSDGSRRVNVNWLELLQMQKPEHLIEIAAGEDHNPQWGCASPLFRSRP